jgi:hypothetical protein
MRTERERQLDYDPDSDPDSEEIHGGYPLYLFSH